MMHQRVFRVFVSSTFSDFAAERNVLQKMVFPELERRCRTVGGTFLGVDLRWGISPQRSLSNRTVSTCLEEINRCQELSPKPNFLILLGDRYGWIPLPETIPEAEWDRLLPKMNGDEVALLKAWYVRDENAVHPVWILKPRTGKWEDQQAWETDVEAPMRNAFRGAADALPAERRLAYCGAATHQEIVRGLFEATDKGQVVAWCRKLNDSPEGFCSQETKKEICRLRSEVLECVNEPGVERGVERDVRYDQIERFQDPSSVVADTTLSPYLKEFADWVTEKLWAQIAAEAGRTASLGMEELQDQFIDARAEGVVGRENEVGAIRQFLSGVPGGVHMVTGPGGQGKTSVLALACRDLEGESAQPRFWIKRFAGAGGAIDSIEALLASLFPDELFDRFWEREVLPKPLKERQYLSMELEEDIRKKCGLSISLPAFPKGVKKKEPDKVSKELEAQLRDLTKAKFLGSRSDLIVKIVGDIGAPRYEYLATYLRFVRYLKGCDLVVILDGIDQWYGAADFLETLERLARAGGDGLEGIWLIAAAREATGVALQGLGQEAWESIAKRRLQQHGRCLSEEQWAWVKTGRERANGNPLSLRVGLEQAVRLHSFDGVPGVGFEYRKLLRYWIDDIASAEQHGELASRALAFLSVAEFGLPESVLLELLAADQMVRDWFGTQVVKTGQVWDLANGLPPILWSRLHMDLGDVLAISGDAGRNVLRLFHPAFRDELAAILKAGVDERKAIAGAAERYLAVSRDGFAEGNIPARLYENADPWALKEVVVQWRHVAPGKLDKLMELPAFAMAVVSLAGAFDVWADAEDSSPQSATLRALLQRHQTELRLQATGLGRIRLILQEAFPKGTLNAAALNILAWTNDVEFQWIRNWQPTDALSPVWQGTVNADSLCRASGERLAIFPNANGKLSRLAVVNPRRLGDAPLFMTVKKEKYGNDFDLPEFEDFVEIGDIFVTRHSIGPIRLWHNGNEVARFVCDLGSDPGPSGLRAKYFKELSAEEILVLYEGGLVATLNFSNLQFDERKPVLELKASGSGDQVKIKIVHQEPDLDDDEDGAGNLRWLAMHNDGSDFSLLLIDDLNCPILVTHADGKLAVCRGQHQGNRGFDLVSRMGLCAFWSTDSALVLMNAVGERLYETPNESDIFSPIAISGSQRTLYCARTYLDNRKYVASLVALDWETATLRWQGPPIKRQRVISAGEFSYVLFEPDGGGGPAVMRLDDEAEPRIVPLVSSDGFWPDACLFDAATSLILASSGRRLALINPESGACRVAVFESHITDFELIGDLVACAHGDGDLRTYRLGDIRRSAEGGYLHLSGPTCITEIGEKHLITASDDIWLLWQADSPGSVIPSVLWEAGTSGKKRTIYHASPLDNGFVTWGDEIIFWRWPGADGALEEEHRIWDTVGGSLNCKGMVLELGGNDFLFEYGNNYDIPGTIGRVRWTGLDEHGGWRENAKWVDDVFAAHEPHRRERSIISPVFPDGWVLVAETREPSREQTESVAAYNIHTGETRVGMAEGHVDATDPWLVELLERHREWISTLRDKRTHEMLRWGGGVTSDGGVVDMPSIYDFGMRQLTEDAKSIVRFKQFQQMTTQRNFMFRDYAGMISAAQRNIGIRAADGQSVPYVSSSLFRVEASMVRERGMAIVTDRGGKLHWLQLMHGSRPCVGANETDVATPD